MGVSNLAFSGTKSNNVSVFRISAETGKSAKRSLYWRFSIDTKASFSEKLLKISQVYGIYVNKGYL